MSNTKIEWATKVWNPVTGCEKVSKGCKNCYAKEIHDMRHKAFIAGKKMPKQYSTPFETVRIHNDRLDIPLHWKAPQRIFVNSMSDLFHENVPFEFIDKVFAVMLTCESHVFQILTKRPERMKEYLEQLTNYKRLICTSAKELDELGIIVAVALANKLKLPLEEYLKNIWLGVSVEDQDTADERIPLLLQTPAAVRFVSAEPLLGPVVLNNYGYTFYFMGGTRQMYYQLNWVIVGGESGKNARPMHPDWARSIRNQCKEVGVPFFFKQWGEMFPVSEEYVTSKLTKCGVPKNIRQTGLSNNFQCYEKRGKKKAGRLLDGVEYNEFPIGGVK